ncbi:MAG: hypothetical protein WD894_03560 [Pirellulales bacterium]
MPLNWIEPEQFLEYRGVRVVHAYKDDFSDIPLEYWYSTSSSAPPGSPFEFDVRELPGYQLRAPRDVSAEHKRVTEAAIDAGLLQANMPVKLSAGN